MRLHAPLILAALADPAAAQEFPQEFQHRFGETTVPEAPERVVSLSYAGADSLWALDVAPVAVRYWYGDYPMTAWPWAEEAAAALYGEEGPEILRGDINIEQIAALEPDLILGTWSGMTEAEYGLLSQIAPTIPPAADQSDYGTPWDDRALIAGRATGHLEEAEAQVTAIRDRIAAVAEDHPDWQGLSAVVGTYWNGTPGAYGPGDIRPQILSGLGFVTPQAIEDAIPAGSFYASLSNEDLSPLDADVLIWLADSDDAGPLREMPLRRMLTAHVEGREIYADTLLSGAFSHASLLSLPYALDRLVPLIEAAADGDPATPVSSSAEAGLAPEAQ
ncbi:ABC transporter substrate-binding protein [Pseudoroseicyclus aestuarii]|uniref:Iron complex transport system substrate-binding protein n=1 Tax=Pseudoroseicyclus aestuarii TaxID=1795041 RepID=A0A318SNQ8_9RHOB|nr:ABC transporter substrate-binding protein [Pseudoroseicyclus aestuarii]PYE82326.1 iron complex transport system substrate-binding protein [Pseudoroseicyclus aestuarii]